MSLMVCLLIKPLLETEHISVRTGHLISMCNNAKVRQSCKSRKSHKILLPSTMVLKIQLCMKIRYFLYGNFHTKTGLLMVRIIVQS